MELSRVYEKHNSEDLQGFFSKAPWEWALSCSGEHGMKTATLERIFATWRSQTAKKTGLQLAVMGVVTRKGHPHLHGVMVGRNKAGKNLLNTSLSMVLELQEDWRKMAHNSAEIEIIRDLGWARYMVTKNLLYSPTASVLQPFNTSLIKKLAA